MIFNGAAKGNREKEKEIKRKNQVILLDEISFVSTGRSLPGGDGGKGEIKRKVFFVLPVRWGN